MLNAEKIKEELVEINLAKQQPEGSVLFECRIDKQLFFRMFASYDFQKKIEEMVAERIVEDFPIEELNKIQSRIDVNAISKGVTISLINKFADKKSY